MQNDSSSASRNEKGKEGHLALLDKDPDQRKHSLTLALPWGCLLSQNTYWVPEGAWGLYVSSGKKTIDLDKDEELSEILDLATVRSGPDFEPNWEAVGSRLVRVDEMSKHYANNVLSILWKKWPSVALFLSFEWEFSPLMSHRSKAFHMWRKQFAEQKAELRRSYMDEAFAREYFEELELVQALRKIAGPIKPSTPQEWRSEAIKSEALTGLREKAVDEYNKHANYNSKCWYSGDLVFEQLPGAAFDAVKAYYQSIGSPMAEAMEHGLEAVGNGQYRIPA